MRHSDDALPQGLGDRFGLRANMEFAINCAQVHVDGVLRDGKFVGNFLFDESTHEMVEDIFFA
jgi:hypothetical protein